MSALSVGSAVRVLASARGQCSGVMRGKSRAALLGAWLIACGSDPTPPPAVPETGSEAAPGAVRDEAAQVRWPDLSSAMAAQGDGSRDAAVIVAIEEYAFLSSIPGAVANGRDWFTYLTRARQVPLERVSFLTNTEATDFAILRALAAASTSAQPGGQLWFIFIGHGAPSVASRDGLLVAVDAQQTVEGLENRSVAQSKVLGLMSKSAATPIALFDACFSGRRYDGQTLIAGLQPTRVVQTAAPAGALVMTAAASNQYAGPLPGEQRPAFSYLALGALRGWGDSNHDGTVTAQEVIDYARGVLLAFLSANRTQTPELLGQRSFPVARGMEPGPDLGRLLLDMKASSSQPLVVGAPPAPIAPSAIPPEPGSSTSSGTAITFDRVAAKRALDEAAALAQSCRPEQGPRGAGRVQVRYAPSGKVVSVSLLTSKFERTAAGSCVTMVFQRAEVPPFSGAPAVVVNKSFEIPE